MGNSYVSLEEGDWKQTIEAAKKRSEEKTANIFDTQIAEAANKSAQAGATQGIANTSRLSADTYAKISEQKARRISAIEDQYNNYGVQHKLALDRQNAIAKQQFEMNKPNFFTYLTGLTGLAAGAANIGGALGWKPFGNDPPKGGTAGSNNVPLNSTYNPIQTMANEKGIGVPNIGKLADIGKNQSLKNPNFNLDLNKFNMPNSTILPDMSLRNFRKWKWNGN